MILPLLFVAVFAQDADRWVGTGNSKFASGDYAGAVEAYTRALRLNPRLAVAYNNRGTARMRLRRYREAADDYGKAVRLRPEEAQYYFNRGNARHFLYSFASAIEDYSAAIAKGIKGSDAYNYRGHARRAAGDPAGAVKDHALALERDAKSSWGFSSRGYAYYDLGKWTDALQDFRRARALPDPDPYCELRIWLIRARLGRREIASEDLRRFLQSEMKGDEIAWVRTIGRYLLGTIGEEKFLSLARARPRECEAYFYAGTVRLIKGETKKAEEYFRRCTASGMLDFTELSSAVTELRRIRERRGD